MFFALIIIVKLLRFENISTNELTGLFSLEISYFECNKNNDHWSHDTKNHSSYFWTKKSFDGFDVFFCTARGCFSDR